MRPYPYHSILTPTLSALFVVRESRQIDWKDFECPKDDSLFSLRTFSLMKACKSDLSSPVVQIIYESIELPVPIDKARTE